MCGIVGIVSKNHSDIVNNLLEGIKRLEYRGYDSSGIAVISKQNIEVIKAKGKISELEKAYYENKISGTIGIAHTRWATHGKANKENAHPHKTDKVAVVHNGIIENFREIKNSLIKEGFAFHSETDSEVIPNLITKYLNQGLSEIDAVAKTISELEGAFSIASIFTGKNNLLIGASKGAPLAIGTSEEKVCLGSDSFALVPFASKIIYLEDGDIAVIDIDKQDLYSIYDKDNNKILREEKLIANTGSTIGKGNFRHFMLKEIFEQPEILSDNIKSYLNQETGTINLNKFPFDIEKINRINIIACGTSYYAGMIAKYWFEQIANIACTVDIASEYRYRNPIIEKDALGIFISQSGETADTLAALKYAKSNNMKTISILNVVESSMARNSDFVMNIYAGPEISVASTKAFSAQLISLLFLVIKIAIDKKSISTEEFEKIISSIVEVPGRISEILSREHHIKEIAKNLIESKSILYIGRGTSYPIALEGALKLKELSYIHAEALAAGELKHGTIALIDEHMPIIAIAPKDELFTKTLSNIEEIIARNGKIVVISDNSGALEFKNMNVNVIIVPAANKYTNPIINIIPVQLLAYHVASLKGTDVDQPRNLAKSVTVE